MGSRGPIPKRSDQRAGHRSKDDSAAITRLPGTPIDDPQGPPLDLVDAHPLAVDWYEGMRRSAQGYLFQPSDWSTARVWAELLSRALKQGDRPSAVLVAAWASGSTELLSTEGARRRVRLELDRPKRVDADDLRAKATVTALRTRLMGSTD
jgi:hypothetical protein